MTMINRRNLIAGAAACAGIVALSGKIVIAAPSETLKVARTPTCGCCGAWIERMREAHFIVEDRLMDDLTTLKTELGVPENLHSCHTAVIDGYVIEGHVPAADIKRLLQERPKILGLAVAGMPVGSPGMEQGGASEQYETIAFGLSGQFVFAKH